MNSASLRVSKNELLEFIRSESGSILYMILYCTLLTENADNYIYVGSMMTLSSKLSMINKIQPVDCFVERNEYLDVFQLIKTKEEVQRIIDNDDNVFWQMDNVKPDNLAGFLYIIYCKVIEYIACLFSQEKFHHDNIAVYPLSCVLDYIIKSNGNVPDYDNNKTFFNDDDLFQMYYPEEWSDGFCIPLSCDMDPTLVCDVDNSYLMSLYFTLQPGETHNKNKSLFES